MDDFSIPVVPWFASFNQFLRPRIRSRRPQIPIRGAEIAPQFDGVAGGECDHRLLPKGCRLRDMRPADLASQPG